MCQKTFKFRDNMRAHFKRHGLAKSHACQECNKMFLTKQYLAQHMLCHDPNELYPCLECGFKFRGMRNLKSHIKTQCKQAKTSPVWSWAMWSSILS